MIVRAVKLQNGYVIPLTDEQAAELRVSDNTPVEVQSLDGGPNIRYASMEESMRAFEKTLGENDGVFRELAKGPEGIGPHDPPPFDLKRW